MLLLVLLILGGFQSAPPLTRRRNADRPNLLSHLEGFNPLLLSRGGETMAFQDFAFSEKVSIRSSSHEEEKPHLPHASTHGPSFNPLLLSRGGETMGVCSFTANGVVSIRSSSHEEEKRVSRREVLSRLMFQSAPPLTRRRNRRQQSFLPCRDSFQSAPPLTRRRNDSPYKALLDQTRFNPLLLSRGGETFSDNVREAYLKFQSAPPLTRRRNDDGMMTTLQPIEFQSAPPLTRRRNGFPAGRYCRV